MSSHGAVYWDPHDADFLSDPYPTYRRPREEAPIYYNEKHDFYAVSRFEGREGGLTDWPTFPSRRGMVLEIIKSGIGIPARTLIMEDPPVHSLHRGLLVRVFTPRRIASIRDMADDSIAMAQTSTVRGRERLPLAIG